MQETPLYLVWRPYIPFFTTGRFRSAGKGYHQHCGPTAVSNCLFAYASRYGFSEVTSLDPALLFQRVASAGTRRLIFWNVQNSKIFGGTADILVPWYIHAVWDSFHLPRPHVSLQRIASAKNVRNSLKKGALIYLELRRHPRYENHHLVVYGMREDGITETLFYAADGWKSYEVLLTAADLKHSFYFEILP